MDDKHRIAKLEDRVTLLETRVAVAESNIKEMKEDVSAIKDNTTWILRLIIGGFITAAIAFIIQGGLA